MPILRAAIDEASRRLIEACGITLDVERIRRDSGCQPPT